MSKASAQRATKEPEIIEEILWQDVDAMRVLCGERDSNLRLIEATLRVTLHPRGNKLRLIGSKSQVAAAQNLLQKMYNHAQQGHFFDHKELAQWLKESLHGEKINPLRVTANLTTKATQDDKHTILITYQNRHLGPKTTNQYRYVDAIFNKAIVFGIGPAGTGKTYLAVLVAVQKLLDGSIDRIILTRPAVEAGERLGFLPGDLAEKINPYLRPLYDALHEMLPPERVLDLLQQGTIEVAPLAFMRGRTLSNAFVILDEAQNTTPEQMKMFLTRLGLRSQMVVTGDLTQTDLPSHSRSGLSDAYQLLQNIAEVEIIHFSEVDVVRHPVVQKIIDAYAQQSLPLEPREN